jgi:SulP family sulfate permease
LTDTIKNVLKEKKEYNESPIVVIVDFTLVVGMDSSAAHAVAKLKKIIHRFFHVEVSIFVTGSGRGGFPCEFALTEALSPEAANQIAAAGLDYNELAESAAATITDNNNSNAEGMSPKVQKGSISVSRGSTSVGATRKLTLKADGRVCESLDDALRFAEDILIAREDSSLESSTDFNDLEDFSSINMTLEEENFYAKKFFRELLPKSSEDMEKTIDTILSAMNREEFSQNEPLWESEAESDSLKLLVYGELVSIIEDTGASEVVKKGNIVGELGLVHGTKRLTTLLCSSEKAILYSLSRTEFEKLRKKKPQVAAAIDGVAIRYLAHRVQHVSNRYFHTTLPV